MNIYLDSNTIDYLKEQFGTAEDLISVLRRKNVHLCFSSTTLSEPARMFLMEDKAKTLKGRKLFNFIKYLLPEIIFIKENGLLLREEYKKYSDEKYSFFCDEKESAEAIRKIKLLSGGEMPEDGRKKIQAWVDSVKQSKEKIISGNLINKGLEFNGDFSLYYNEALKYLNKHHDYLLKDSIDKRVFDLVIAAKSAKSPIYMCLLSVFYLNYHAIEHGEIAKDKNFDLIHIVASSVCDKLFTCETDEGLQNMVKAIGKISGENNLLGINDFNRILGV